MCMCFSPHRQVDRAHLRATELECQLAALAAQASGNGLSGNGLSGTGLSGTGLSGNAGRARRAGKWESAVSGNRP